MKIVDAVFPPSLERLLSRFEGTRERLEVLSANRLNEAADIGAQAGALLLKRDTVMAESVRAARIAARFKNLTD